VISRDLEAPCGPAAAFAACASDDGTRESPALLADFSIGGAPVVRLLDELACRHRLPAEIVMDNGPEFTGRALFAWSARTGVRLGFIPPGKPFRRRWWRASSAGFGTSA
jgi:putative transposase